MQGEFIAGGNESTFIFLSFSNHDIYFPLNPMRHNSSPQEEGMGVNLNRGNSYPWFGAFLFLLSNDEVHAPVWTHHFPSCEPTLHAQQYPPINPPCSCPQGLGLIPHPPPIHPPHHGYFQHALRLPGLRARWDHSHEELQNQTSKINIPSSWMDKCARHRECLWDSCGHGGQG